MSLFGLFHLAFGLGVLTKDAISDSISDTTNREKAEREGRSTYLVNGRGLRSTKTGAPAYMDYGTRKGGHLCVRDAKTNEIIEDLTVQKRYKDQPIEKAKATENKSIFYRTTKFDTANAHPSIYVCDSIPGYFEKNREDISIQIDGKFQTAYGVELYELSRVVKSPSWYKVTHILDHPLLWYDGKHVYYKDGTLYETCEKNKNGHWQPVWHNKEEIVKKELADWERKHAEQNEEWKKSVGL